MDGMNNRALKLSLCLAVAICMSACATAYDKRGIYHKVRGGESIQRIARFYHVPVQELAEWNNIQNESEIESGLKLYIPGPKEPSQLRYKKLPKSERAKFDMPIVLDKTKFIWPVAGEVLSLFGVRNGRRHDGIDIKAKKGTPVKAAGSGEVAFSGQLKGYGNIVIVRHKDDYFTVYAHNSKNLPGKGHKVAKGETIAYVGATGRATGPHLHFEVRQGQKARNPMFLLPAKAETDHMIAKKEKIDAPLDKKDEPKKEKQDIELSRRKEMMEKLKAKRSK